jgi:hypothetical protein
MKSFRKTLWLTPLMAGLFVLACVTINIYFPAEKVESAAGEIVTDIRGEKADEGKSPAKPEQNSRLRRTFYALTGPALAWAQDATTVSNPTIRALKSRMKSRFAQMKPYYQKGALREGSDGYVDLGKTGGLGLKEKRDLSSLVDAENRDRKTLYAEVARALDIEPSQINRVAEIFAKEWQKSVR